MSLKVPMPTLTLMVPALLAIGVTSKVAWVALTLLKVPALPPVMTTSLAVKLAPTSSLKTKLKITGPVAVAAETSSKMATVGAVRSGAGAVLGALITVADGGGVASPPPQAATRRDAATAQVDRARSFVNRFMLSS